MINRNDFPCMGEVLPRFQEHASKLKEASEKALDSMRRGRSPPKAYTVEILQAVAAFTARTTEEPRLRDILNAVVKLSADSYSRDYQIKNQIKDLGKQAPQQVGARKSTSYAKVAEAEPTAIQTTKLQQENQVHKKTIRIKMNNPEISIENKRSSPVALATKVNKAIQDLSISQTNIGAAKALRTTGDIEIIAANQEEAEKLCKDQRWTKELAATAQVKTRTFGVIIKGVAIQDLQGDQQQMKSQLQKENEHTTQIDPYWVGYLHKPREQDRRIPLVIELQDVKQANQVIQNGIFIGAVWYSGEVYNRRCRLTQCFKCWRYGHLAAVCPHEERCGKCSGGHNHQTCSSQRLECTGCGGEHEARSKLCTARGREVDRIEKLRKTTPAIYPEVKEITQGKDTQRIRGNQSAKPSRSSCQSQSSCQGQSSCQDQSSRQASEEEWCEIVRNGKKRKVIMTSDPSTRATSPESSVQAVTALEHTPDPPVQTPESMVQLLETLRQRPEGPQEDSMQE